MIISEFDSARINIDGVTYPKLFYAKLIKGDVIEIRSVFTDKLFVVVNNNQLQIDGVTYDNPLDSLDVLNELINLNDNLLLKYYQYIITGRYGEIVKIGDYWYYVNYGTGDLETQILNTQVGYFDGVLAYLTTTHTITSEQKWQIFAKLPDQTVKHGIDGTDGEVIIGRTATEWFAAWNNDGTTTMQGGTSDDDWHLFEISVNGFKIDGELVLPKNTNDKLSMNNKYPFIGALNADKSPSTYVPSSVAWSKIIGTKYEDTVTSQKAVDDMRDGNRLANTGLAYDPDNDYLIIAEYNEDNSSRILIKDKSMNLIDTIDVTAHVDHIQGIALDSVNSHYYAWGTQKGETPSESTTIFIKVNSSGTLLDSHEPDASWGRACSSLSYYDGYLYTGHHPIRKIDISNWSSTTVDQPGIARGGEGFYIKDGDYYMGTDYNVYKFNDLFGYIYGFDNPSPTNQSEGMIVDNDGNIWWNADEYYHDLIPNGNKIYKIEVAATEDETLQEIHFQNGRGNQADDIYGNHGTLTGITDSFWANASPYPSPARLVIGASKYSICESAGTSETLGQPDDSNVGNDLLTESWILGTGVTDNLDGSFTLTSVANGDNALRMNNIAVIGKYYFAKFKIKNYVEGGIRVIRPGVAAFEVNENGSFRNIVLASASDDFIIGVYGTTTLDIYDIEFAEIEAIDLTAQTNAWSGIFNPTGTIDWYYINTTNDTSGDGYMLRITSTDITLYRNDAGSLTQLDTYSGVINAWDRIEPTYNTTTGHSVTLNDVEILTSSDVTYDEHLITVFDNDVDDAVARLTYNDEKYDVNKLTDNTGECKTEYSLALQDGSGNDTKGNAVEFSKNVGFWNTGNTLLFPDDATINSIFDANSALSVLKNPLTPDYETIAAIDLTGIDENDYVHTVVDGVIKNIAIDKQ